MTKPKSRPEMPSLCNSPCAAMLVDLAVLVAGMDRGSFPGFSKVMHETKPHHHGKCKNPQQQRFADGEAIS